MLWFQLTSAFWLYLTSQVVFLHGVSILISDWNAWQFWFMVWISTSVFWILHWFLTHCVSKSSFLSLCGWESDPEVLVSPGYLTTFDSLSNQPVGFPWRSPCCHVSNPSPISWVPIWGFVEFSVLGWNPTVSFLMLIRLGLSRCKVLFHLQDLLMWASWPCLAALLLQQWKSLWSTNFNLTWTDTSHKRIFKCSYENVWMLVSYKGAIN